MTDEDFAAVVAEIIHEHGPEPVWLFGYGSLLWNPGFDFEELGIHDSYLWELQHLVAAEIRSMFPPSAA